MKSVMMKWLQFYCTGRGFWIYVSVVLSQELCLHQWLFAKNFQWYFEVSYSILYLDTRFSKLFLEVFCVFPEKTFLLHLVAACLFAVAGFLWGHNCCVRE